MTRHLPQEERVEQILRAARKVFTENGYRAARMTDVADRAGLSKGAVYFYFKSKRELFEALVEQEHTLAHAILDRVASQGQQAPAQDNLEAMLRGLLRHFFSFRRAPTFFLVMGEMAARDDHVRAKYMEIHNRLLAQISEIVAQGVQDGTFRQGVDPMVVAQVLKASSDGLTMERAIGADPTGDPDEIIRGTIDLFLHGILPASVPETA